MDACEQMKKQIETEIEVGSPEINSGSHSRSENDSSSNDTDHESTGSAPGDTYPSTLELNMDSTSEPPYEFSDRRSCLPTL